MESELIPLWRAALDPDFVWTQGIDGTPFFGYEPWRELLLTLDTGERAHLEEVLEDASTAYQREPELLPWLRARLAARS